MSTNINTGGTGNVVPYVSLADLRAAHISLLKRYRNASADGAVMSELRAFLRNSRALGIFLSDTEERWSAQSILDYWATTLYQQTQSTFDVTLAEFDPQQAPILPDDACPYLGLDAFLERDHDRFFGRKQIVADLLAKLQKQRLLVIIGPSGSGKSSLALAGLLAELRQGALPGSKDWRYYPRIVPGSNPLSSLARVIQPARHPGSTPVLPETWQQQQVPLFRSDLRHLARLIGQEDAMPVTLIVDQFEEVFTLCDDLIERRQFIANLLGMALLRNPQHRVIFTMRSDFESYLFQFPTFEPLFRNAIVRLMPLNAAELREAIERPADQAGLKFESGIVDALIHDILGEPAALPLLQFTLFKFWQRREYNRVTWASYKQLGGGRVALSNSADQLYQQLIPEEQETLRRILLLMVRPGEGLEVTSSRVRREQFYQAEEDPGRVDRVLTKLIDERLIRVTEGATPADTQVEIAHEALVRNWLRLVGWISQAREDLRQRYRLTRDAEDWNAHGRDQTLLLGETRLHEMERLTDLSRLERDFIAASRNAIQRQREAEEQANRERDLALQRELSQQLDLAIERERYADERTGYAEQQIRWNRRLRILTYGLAIITGLAIVLAGIAFYQWGDAQKNAQRAQLLALITAARNAPNPNYGLVWANVIAQTGKSDSLVKADLSREIQELLYEVLQEGHPAIKVQPVENHLSTPPIINAAVWSPDGTKLLSANADGIARIFDPANPQFPAQFVHDDRRDVKQNSIGVTSAAWSPDSKYIVTTGEDGFARIWQAQGGDGSPLFNLQHNQPGTDVAGVNDVAWSNTPRYVVTASGDQTYLNYVVTASGNQAYLWEVEIGKATTLVDIFSVDTKDVVIRVSWDPSGKYVLTASADRTLRIWDVKNGTYETLNPANSKGDLQADDSRDTVTSVAWSPDGQMILAGKANNNVDIWSVTEHTLLATLVGHGNSIKSVAWSPDSASVVTGSDDGTARIWNVSALAGATSAPDQVQTIIDLLVLRGENPISAVGWNPNLSQQEIMTASGQQIYVYHIGTAEELNEQVASAVQALDPSIRYQALSQMINEIEAVAPTEMIADIAASMALAGTAMPSPAVTSDTTATATATLQGVTQVVITALATWEVPSDTPPPTIEPASPTPAPLIPTFTPTPLAPSDSDLARQLNTIFNDTGGTFNAIVIDRSINRTIYARTAEAPLLAASLIKLPIALTLYHMAAMGEISLDERLVLQESDKVAGTGSIQGAPTGSSYALSDLAYRMLRESDNTASNMVLTRIGFSEVNAYMQQLGATETIVERRFFDQAAIDAGEDIRTSPQDMALLLGFLFDSQANPAAAQLAPVDDLLAALQNNQDSYQKIRAGLPPGIKVWNKTGVVSRMEHDAAVVEMPNGHQLIIVIMSDNVPNDSAIKAIGSAAKAIYDYKLELR